MIPSPSVKIQIMGGKVCFRCIGKTLLGDVNKLFVLKSLLTTPSNVLLLHLKPTFPPIIWIFTEGDGIESRPSFKIFFTLNWYVTLWRVSDLMFSPPKSESFDLESSSSSPFLRSGSSKADKSPICVANFLDFSFPSFEFSSSVPQDWSTEARLSSFFSWYFSKHLPKISVPPAGIRN